jgi:hypothetical protein
MFSDQADDIRGRERAFQEGISTGNIESGATWLQRFVLSVKLSEGLAIPTCQAKKGQVFSVT